jgi:hypothetical protein
MNIPWKVFFSGFLDGFSALLLMFQKDIRYPGLTSLELKPFTTPEVLAQYRAVNSALPDAILNLRDNTLAYERTYARSVRIAGCVELAALIMFICFLSSHYQLLHLLRR